MPHQQKSIPHVFDRFRFHMTLTDKLSQEAKSKMRLQLEERCGPLRAEEYTGGALKIFEQERPGADFVVRSRFALKRGSIAP